MKKLIALLSIAAAFALAGAVPAGATAKIHCVPWYCPPPLIR